MEGNFPLFSRLLSVGEPGCCAFVQMSLCWNRIEFHSLTCRKEYAYCAGSCVGTSMNGNLLYRRWTAYCRLQKVIELLTLCNAVDSIIVRRY